MDTFSREKINMLSTALLSELATLSPDTADLFQKFCSEPLARYNTPARARVLSILPEAARDAFSMGYICGFIGRFVQLEEERAGQKPSDILPKNLIMQVLSDIFGRMKGPFLARKTVKLSTGKDKDFVSGYFSGGRDFDNFTAFLIGVAEVKVPSYIDRPQIILIESDGITLKKSEFERWSEDLATLAQRTLAGDISAYLPGAIVKSKNFINEKFDFVVYVEINDMTGTFADKATLDVWWTIVDNDNNMVFKKQTKIQNELGDTYTDFVIAQSNLLDLLSKEIATELTRLSNPQD